MPRSPITLTLHLLTFVSAACSSPGGREATSGDASAQADGAHVPVGQPCDDNTDCGGGSCDNVAGVCRECRDSRECTVGEVCTAGVCARADVCQNDLDCTPSGQVCSEEKMTCSACETAADCGGTQACIGWSCATFTPCDSALDCPAGRQLCKTVTASMASAYPEGVAGVCVDCSSDDECGVGDRCIESRCYPVCRWSGLVCGDNDGLDCGTCPGTTTCAYDQSVCLDHQPLPVELRSDSLRDDATHWYGQVQDASRLRIARVDKQSGAATLHTLDREYTNVPYVAVGEMALVDGVGFFAVGSEIMRFEIAATHIVPIWASSVTTDSCHLAATEGLRAVVRCGSSLELVALDSGTTIRSLGDIDVGLAALWGDALYFVRWSDEEEDEAELVRMDVVTGENVVLGAVYAGPVRRSPHHIYFTASVDGDDSVVGMRPPDDADWGVVGEGRLSSLGATGMVLDKSGYGSFVPFDHSASTRLPIELLHGGVVFAAPGGGVIAIDDESSVHLP